MAALSVGGSNQPGENMAQINRHIDGEPLGSILLSLSSVSRSVMSDSCDPMNCSPPGFAVYRILQARILEWIAIPFSIFLSASPYFISCDLWVRMGLQAPLALIPLN